jgi:DNA polymerase I
VARASAFYYGVANYVVRGGELVRDFYPYFYAIGDGPPPRLPGVRAVERADLEPWAFSGVSYAPLGGRRAYRIVADAPALVPVLRERYVQRGYMTSQSNVPYGYRASADLDGGAVAADPLAALEPLAGRKPRVLAVDVEVVGRDVYIGFASSDGDVTVTRSPRDVAAAAAGHDAVVGYNSYAFDALYLRDVMPTRYVVDAPDGLKPHVDLYVIAESRAASAFGKVESGSTLYEVALQVGALPEGVGVRELMRAKLARARLAHMSAAELRQYLSLDVRVTHALGSKWHALLSALGTLLGVSPMAQVQLLERGTTALMCEVAYHRELGRRGRLYAERFREIDYGGEDKTRAGAPGVYSGVAELDFSMMYPATYTAFRVAPDNARECPGGFEVRTSAGVKRICFDGESPVWEAMRQFFEMRRATKRIRDALPEADWAVKILANSAYGGFARRAGVGIVNEYAAAFIFQYTSRVFDSLWQWLETGGAPPVYGDTDSVYVVARSPERLLQDANDYVRGLGPLYEMKLEGVWERFVLPPRRAGGAAEKSYVKAAGETVVVKGSKLRPHDLPRGMRYYAWRETLGAWLRGAGRLGELVERWVMAAPLEELFVEKSTSLRDLFRNARGEPKSKLHHMSDIPALAALAVRSGGTAAVTERSINGRRAPGSTILDAMFIPVETRGEEKKYVLYVDGRAVMASVRVRYSCSADGCAASVSAAWRPLPELAVRSHAARYVLSHDAVSSLVSLESLARLA